MTRGLTVTKEIHFARARRGRKVIAEGSAAVASVLGRVPRLTRLMALAIHMEDLIRLGEVADYAELARLSYVSRARVTQIMSLLHLAPDIQEAILGLPRAATGRHPVSEKVVRAIAAVPDWRKQRAMWRQIERMLVGP